MNQAKNAFELINILKSYRLLPRATILICTIVILAYPIFANSFEKTPLLANMIISICAIIILLTINFSSKKGQLDDFIGKEISEINQIKDVLHLAQKERAKVGVITTDNEEVEGLLGGINHSPVGDGFSFQLTDDYGKNTNRVLLTKIKSVKII